MVDKDLAWTVLKLSNGLVLGRIKKALKDENLVDEFKNKFSEYGKKAYEYYLRKREEVIGSLLNESLKEGLERLLNSIDNRIICFGKEDINPELPTINSECIIGAYLEKSILDAIYPHIKAGDYNKAMEVISYLSSENVSKKIDEAFRNMYLYKLGGYIPDILEANKDINEFIKKLDNALKYTSDYMRDAIEDLFYNNREGFLKKIEYGIQLDLDKEKKYRREK